MANKLQYEHSPYLQQHKDNPVDWHAWGQEAFDRAQKEDKPILLSIGYATCHWCHVMAHESFVDKRIAGLMNELFVNIKVDREEMPAVDHYYMDAIQLLTGRGGWPLNCFLTPDQKPFLGGTYFPPEDRGQQVSWRKVLLHVAKVFQQQRDQVELQARRIHERIESQQSDDLESLLDWEKSERHLDLEKLWGSTQRNWDLEYGGMKGAPKFPMPHVYANMLSHALYNKDKQMESFVRRTAKAYIQGGLFDPIRGGFSRYCVDNQWHVPHFEKMLYDNAGILKLVSLLHKTKEDPALLWAVNSTVDFLKTEMCDSDNLFFSAVDADLEGEEGKFYTWTFDELERILEKEDLDLLQDYFEIEKNGNWEGTNVLYSNLPKAESFFKKHGLEGLNNVLNILDNEASRRIKPEIDTKKLVDWNAMLADSLLNVARYAKSDKAEQMGLNALNQLLEEFVSPSGVIDYHAKKEKEKYGEATLDDYAFVIQACITAYSVTMEEWYLEKAKTLSEIVFKLFANSDTALFHSLGSDSKQLKYRPIAYYDSPYPSGNAIMCKNLYILGKYIGHTAWLDHAEKMVHQLKEKIQRAPTAFGGWLDAISHMTERNIEIAIIGPQAEEWGRSLVHKILPDTVLMAQEHSDESYPLLDRHLPANQTKLFLCENYSCRLPHDTMESFLEEFAKSNPILDDK